MVNKISRLYILLAILSTAGVLAFADQPSSSVNDKSHQALDKQTEQVYQQAVDLYQHKKFAEAKKKFEEISWVTPDYKDTMKYLAQITRDAKEEQERLTLEQAQSLYSAAVSLFDKKNMDGALEKFNDTEKLLPGFKSTRKYITRIEHWKADQQKREKERLQEQGLREKTDRAQKSYDQALGLYRAHRWVESRVQFESVEQIVPDLKHTRRYLKKIESYIAKESPPKPAAVATPAPVDAAATPEAESFHQQELALEQQRVQELKDRTDQAEKIYVQAVKTYRAHQWGEARGQFEAVEQIIPDYKHTHRYLQKIDDITARADKTSTPPAAPMPPAPAAVVSMPVPAPPEPAAAPTPDQTAVAPVQIKAAVSLEDQQKQAQDIAALAEKSAQLYRQIADVADDESTVQTKNKMAAVDDMLKNLKDNKERVLRQMQEDQYKQQQEQLKAKAQEHRLAVEKLYHDGVEYLRSHEYSKAKIKFLELDNMQPDYRSTRRYLIHIEEDLKRANVEAVTDNEKKEAEHLRKLEDTASTAEISHIKQEEEKQQLQEQQQQASLKELAQKASDINDDIIRLSQQQDYQAMKVKFAELEKTVAALTVLKDEMSNQKGRQERSKQLIHDAIVRRDEMLKEQKQEDREIHAYSVENPLAENHPILSNQTSDADFFKQREIMQEQNTLFSEGVDLYEHKKYTQAKLLFGELSAQHDRRAEAWLKKVDHAITQELLKSEEAEASERTAFLQDQLGAQRELVIIQERERQRQKKLTEELERQKRLYEDDRLLQLRKEETMRVQDRERRRQEEKRLRAQRENEKKQETFRFHKIETVVKAQPPVVVQPPSQPKPPVVVPPAPVAAAVVVVKPPVMSAKQLQDQIDLSNKRKAYLDEKNKKDQMEQDRRAKIKAEEDARQKRRAQREAERQAKLKAQADARQKREEERQKEREQRQELRAQREADRQARLKAQAEAKLEEDKARAEKSAQEQKRKEEFLREQEQQREERLRQEQIVREEAQHQEELERQEHQREAQLEAQRESVRKQLEDGVEAMYQDALSLYQQGDYSAAADRFKDIQDIIPGYKRSEQYMDESREKSLTAVKPDISSPAVASSTTAPASHQDNVSKALDIFDPNAK